jgi:hypothetical protein
MSDLPPEDEGLGGPDLGNLLSQAMEMQQQADQAKRAALDATGGGTVNSVESDSENGATYEVEVTKPDGTTVDVRLDDGFKVVVIEGDGEDSGSDG